jgi:hypothetical protein
VSGEATFAMDRRGSSWLRPERVKELTLLGIIAITVVLFGATVEGYLSGRFFNRVTTSVVTLLHDLLATRTGLSVVKGSPEATALGNAIVQGIALRRFDGLVDARLWLDGRR